MVDNSGNASISLQDGIYPYSISKDNFELYEGEVTVSGEDKLVEIELISGLETQAQYQLKIYPNPVEDVLHIERSNNTPVVIDLFTESGILINSFQWNSEQFELDVHTFKTGFFIIQIRGDNLHKSLQFIKK